MTTKNAAGEGVPPMSLYLRLCVLYMLSSVLIVFLFRDNPAVVFESAFVKIKGTAPSLGFIAFVIAALTCAIMVFAGRQALGPKLKAIGFAFIAQLVFYGTFSIVKTSIPNIVPFYADPFFAEVDRVLHGGVDPWVWVFAWDAFLPIGELVLAYHLYWVLPVVSFPILLAAFDSDADRQKRFLVLYLIAWLFIGNILAVMGSSVGPIYYDRFYGGDRFAEFMAAWETSAVIGTPIEVIQGALWVIYSEHGQAFGSGISAWPSVHVSTTVVLALYLMERSKLLIPLGFGYLALILILSVYTGYHYAIDGYVSIAIMIWAWAWLRNRATKSTGAQAARDVTGTGVPAE